MAAQLFDPGAATRPIAAVEYAVNASGDTLFPCTIGSSDSPDYVSDKTEALAQNKILNPLAKEVVA